MRGQTRPIVFEKTQDCKYKNEQTRALLKKKKKHQYCQPLTIQETMVIIVINTNTIVINSNNYNHNSFII